MTYEICKVHKDKMVQIRGRICVREKIFRDFEELYLTSSPYVTGSRLIYESSPEPDTTISIVLYGVLRFCVGCSDISLQMLTIFLFSRAPLYIISLDIVNVRSQT